MMIRRDRHQKSTTGRRRGAARLRGRTARNRPLAIEPLEDRRLLAGLPTGAHPDDTAEYMLGDVLVTLVLMESDPDLIAANPDATEPNSEDWTLADIQNVKDTVVESLDWWEETLALTGSVHTLSFEIDYTYADHPVPAAYEPIAEHWSASQKWMGDFLEHAGYANSNSWQTTIANLRAFNHAQRTAFDTDWSFTIFVANSTADADNKFSFETSTDITGAHSYAGGLGVVTPSERTARVISHEVGHIFYTLDEYANGASYSDHRGYYDTQNLNGERNRPVEAPEIVNSVMQSEPRLSWAYDAVTAATRVSPSAREMIGWKDSDEDGIFDVLDVDHRLDGSGVYDPQSGNYRFIGTSSVAALTNQNPVGLGNDITLNRIDRVEYRFDQGLWQTAAEYPDRPVSIALDLTIPVPAGALDIEIRTVETRGDVPIITSAVFTDTMGLPATSVVQPGINGFVWGDVNQDGVRDAVEPGLAYWTIQVLDASGQPLAAANGIEPDDYSVGQLYVAELSVEMPGESESIPVGVLAADRASTGSQVFAYFYQNKWRTEFKASYDRAIGLTTTSRPDEGRLRVAFPAPVAWVSLDAIGNRAGSYGRLEVYDADDHLVGRYTTQGLALGEFESMTVSRTERDIAYAVAWGNGRTESQGAGSSVLLDNLRYGVPTTAVTNRLGAYTLPHIGSGSYTVEVLPPDGWSMVPPATATRAVVLAAGETKQGVDFGLLPDPGTSFWYNRRNAADVDDNGRITAEDVQLVIDELSARGIGDLPAPASAAFPYVDSTGDGRISLRDASSVYGEVLSEQANGAGANAAASSSSAPPSGSPAVAEPSGEGATVPELSAEGSSVSMRDGPGAETRIPMSGDARWSSRFSVLPDAAAYHDMLKREFQRFEDTLKRELQWPQPLLNHLPEALSKAYAQPAETRESGAEIISEWDDVFADLAEDVAVAWGKLA